MITGEYLGQLDWLWMILAFGPGAFMLFCALGVWYVKWKGYQAKGKDE